MEYPPQDDNLIDTEKGSEIAEGILDMSSRIKEVENIEDVSLKINTLLKLSVEAKRNGQNEISSMLNKRAIELDDQNNEFLEKETEQRLERIRDQIDNYRGFGHAPIEEIEELKQTEFPAEQFEEMEKREEKKSVPKKSLAKRLAARINSFFISF